MDIYDNIPYLSTGNRCDELGSILSDALILILLAHHEAGDVLHEQDGDVSLATQLYKVRTLSQKCPHKINMLTESPIGRLHLERALGEENAIVSDYAHLHAVELSKARN